MSLPILGVRLSFVERKSSSAQLSELTAYILCLSVLCKHTATRIGPTSPSGPMSGAFCFVVSCGVRLSEVDLEAILAVALEVKKWITAHVVKRLIASMGSLRSSGGFPNLTNGSFEVGIISNYLRFEEILQRQRTAITGPYASL